jgi:hypothetical protein
MRALKCALAVFAFVAYFAGMTLLSAVGMRLAVSAMYPPPTPLL